MKIYRRKFHLATAAVAFIGVLSFLPITPASAGTHEAPSFQSAPSEVGDNGAPFQLTADPGHFQKTSRSDGSAADSTLTGYTFQLDAIPSTSVYNRVQVRKSGESYYSVVVRSTETTFARGHLYRRKGRTPTSSWRRSPTAPLRYSRAPR